jgi:acyl-coenzyme A synthetase/AMP-(fatty) acid ligase
MNITDLLSTWALEAPEAPAVVTLVGGLSFAELDRAVTWSARSFKQAGLAPGDIVAIDLSHQTQHLIASLALARLGAGQFGFHDTDPAALRAELTQRLNIVATVTDKPTQNKAHSPAISPPPASLNDIRELKPVEFETARDGALPFMILRSSGTTTGVPKLAMLNHANGERYVRNKCFGLRDGPGTRYMSLISVSFNGTKSNVHNCVLSGGCVAFNDGITEAQPLVDFITRHRINYMTCVPVHVGILLGISKENEILLPGLEIFRVGSTMVPQVLREDIQSRLSPNLHIGYGINEIGTIAIASPEMVRKFPGVVGMLTPGTQAEVIDDDGHPLPTGKAGKLRLKMPGMVSGYIDAPEDTARNFQDGWYHTGDLAEFTPDGALIHHGRADDVMIYDGININPAEIENTLLRHPAIAEAAAFPIHSEVRGDVPFAAIVTKSEVSGEELTSHCWSWLGPRSPEGLMIVSKLPRNARGKVLKHELAKAYKDQTAKNSGA